MLFLHHTVTTMMLFLSTLLLVVVVVEVQINLVLIMHNSFYVGQFIWMKGTNVSHVGHEGMDSTSLILTL